MKITERTFHAQNGNLHYFETDGGKQPLVLIHAQGVDATSYGNVIKPLSQKYHVYAVDCFGHGKSSHDPEHYTVCAIGSAIAELIRTVIGSKPSIVGHSSGGLIAAYIAATYDLCDTLFLEDPPLFSSQGERRFHTFHYLDLSTVCHGFLAQTQEADFVLYYFIHQKAWEFFPPDIKAKIYDRMVLMAKKNRLRHPDRNLKVPFWPKYALAAFQGMNAYDPRFGEAFYQDTFHAGIPHTDMLAKIQCNTVIMKAKTNFDKDGILLAAMNDEDAAQAQRLIKSSHIVRFDCGHGVHVEKKSQFVALLMEQANG